MELTYNSLFTGDESWVIGKVYMKDNKTSKNYDVIHKSACAFLGHFFEKLRADHLGGFLLLDTPLSSAIMLL